MGLLAQANEDVLLAMLDAKRVMNGKPMLRPELMTSGNGGGGDAADVGGYGTSVGGIEQSEGKPLELGNRGEGSAESGWYVGHSRRGVPLGLVMRLATRYDLESTLQEMEPPLLRPEMPRCHAKDLRVPQTFKEAMQGEHREQFMEAGQREVFGLVEAGAFLPVGP